MRWEALAEEGDSPEKGRVGAHGNVCVQGKAGGTGMQQSHSHRREKPRTVIHDQDERG